MWTEMFFKLSTLWAQIFADFVPLFADFVPLFADFVPLYRGKSLI